MSIVRSSDSADSPTVLLLTGVRSYRLPAFRRAAERLGVEVVTGMDLPPALADQWPEAVALPFDRLDAAVAAIEALNERKRLRAIMAVDDSGSVLAATASARLGLAHNAPDAALAARDKLVMRRMLAGSGLNTPAFWRFTTDSELVEMTDAIAFPAVVKPTNLNGSRGVIRVNNVDDLAAAVARLRRLLAPEAGAPPISFLIERYIPGIEVALEGLLDAGELQVLALFDKPDPLEGPYFEETIYVTPSRLPADVQASVVAVTRTAAEAIGLSTGPVHAELRINEQGAWVVEIAGRSIGGLCSEVLRFGVDGSLEELILRQAIGLDTPGDAGATQASGVMMIPIPGAGMLRRIDGVETAEAVPLIDKVELTLPLDYPVKPLPEGDSYLGFIFARGPDPAAVEKALRKAHSALHIAIDPIIDLVAV